MSQQRHVVSSTYRKSPQHQVTTVYRHQNLEPSIHIETKKSQIPQPQNMSPVASFGGGGGSSIRGKRIRLKNQDYYEGDLNDRGQFQGYGRYISPKERIEYEGYFQNGKQHGKGQLSRILSDSYSNSQYSNSKYLLYDGQWSYGQRNGYGKNYYDQNQKHYYQGPWFQDKRHGDNGTYISSQYEYTGQWKNGKMSGKGVLMNKKTQTQYDGIFQNNQFLRGVINYANKDQYRGNVRYGHRDDNQGRYIYRNRGAKSCQSFSSSSSSSSSSSENNNKYQNNHKNKTTRRKDTSKSIGHHHHQGIEKEYVGGWKQGIKHGKCAINYHNGDCSKYAYDNGKLPITFQCTYLWADGSQFNGWLKRDSYNNYIYDRGSFKKRNGEFFEV